MPGWLHVAAARASREKFSMKCALAASLGRRIFTARKRFSDRSIDLYTVPMPPMPMGLSSKKFAKCNGTTDNAPHCGHSTWLKRSLPAEVEDRVARVTVDRVWYYARRVHRRYPSMSPECASTGKLVYWCDRFVRGRFLPWPTAIGLRLVLTSLSKTRQVARGGTVSRCVRQSCATRSEARHSKTRAGRAGSRGISFAHSGGVR